MGARLTPEQMARLERVATAIPVPPGAQAYTKADALRMTVEEGLVVLEARYGITKKAKTRG